MLAIHVHTRRSSSEGYILTLLTVIATAFMIGKCCKNEVLQHHGQLSVMAQVFNTNYYHWILQLGVLMEEKLEQGRHMFG